jgi:hypothetical protein
MRRWIIFLMAAAMSFGWGVGSAAPFSNGESELTWQKAESVDLFVIEWLTSANPTWTQVGTSTTTSFTHTYTPFPAGDVTDYTVCYRVAAVKGTTQSGWSSEAVDATGQPVGPACVEVIVRTAEERDMPKRKTPRSKKSHP